MRWGTMRLALQILAQHPAAYRAMQALGRNVKPVPAYNMDVVTEGSQPAEVVTTTTTTRGCLKRLAARAAPTTTAQQEVG